MSDKKIAILGASYLQRPLVRKAAAMGLETHVFAWPEGDVCSDIADHYYPVSILEKEEILRHCRAIGVQGIVSIASDIAMPTVNYVAAELNLVGNSIEATLNSTDKYRMREALTKRDLPCPRYALYTEPSYDASVMSDLPLPVVIKPTDRSGSLGVTKVSDRADINQAIAKALEQSISRRAIVEEFVEGRECSVEMISWRGTHYPLALTDKETTGAPFFVETAHRQPANVDESLREKVFDLAICALDALGIEYGASHTEVLIQPDGRVTIVEVAGRMGGDCIGSHMVYHSTGYDFLQGTLEVAMGSFSGVACDGFKQAYSGVQYVCAPAGVVTGIVNHAEDDPDVVEAIPILQIGDGVDSVMDGSGKRCGVVVYANAERRPAMDAAHVLVYQTSGG